MPILYVDFAFAFFRYLLYQPRYKFDREKWIPDKHTSFEMRDDMVESGFFIGKSSAEIIEFIGKPKWNDSTDIWKYDPGISGAGYGWQFNSPELTFEDRKV